MLVYCVLSLKMEYKVKFWFEIKFLRGDIKVNYFLF